MALCSLLLYLVSDCMIHSNTVIYQKEFWDEKYERARTIVEKVKFFKLKNALPRHSFNKCFAVSTVCVLGFFNRPTFVVFAFPIVFQWLLRGMGSKTVSFLDFNLRIGFFLLAALPSLIYCILVDSFYFKFITIAEIEAGDVGINNFVVTPLNFLRYNLDPAKTAAHGVHPKWVHVLVNIPLLFNILGVIAIVTLGNMAYHFSHQQYQYLPRAQSIVGLMTSAVICPTLALSFINHQEARFLLPITLPIVLLHAPKLKNGFLTSNPFKQKYWLYEAFYTRVLHSKVSSKYLLKVWYAVNLAMTVFFGFIHQGGVTQLADHMSQSMATKGASTNIHLVTSHVYDLPSYLLMLPSTKILHQNPENGHKYRKSKQFFLHEYGSLDLELLVKRVKLLVDVNEMRAADTKYKYKLFLAIPTSRVEHLERAFRTASKLLRRTQIKVFYPHFSSEALPDFYAPHPHEACTLNGTELSASGVLKQFSSIVHQFGLVLYRIEVKRPEKRNQPNLKD